MLRNRFKIKESTAKNFIFADTFLQIYSVDVKIFRKDVKISFNTGY